MICPNCCESVGGRPGGMGCQACIDGDSIEALVATLKESRPESWETILAGYFDSVEARAIEWSAYVAGTLYRPLAERWYRDGTDDAVAKFRRAVIEVTREEIV